jgi:hypothetical protein
MNDQRRKRITELVVLLEGLKADIEFVQQEEQDYYDNMPENLQGSDKGQAAEAAADSLQEAADEVGNAIDNLNSSIE